MNTILQKLKEEAKKDNVEKIVVGALIFKDKKILVVRRSVNEFLPGLIEIPSGKVDKGESIDEALIREVKEETNLDVIKIKNYVGNFDYQSQSGKKSRQLNFIAQVEGSISLNPKEHDAFFLFDKNEILNYKLNVSDKTKQIIISSFNQLDD